MTVVPQPNRIHAQVWSRAASKDGNLVKNHLSANMSLSLKTGLAIVVAIALLFVVLWLLD